jgi:cytoskeletal protein RodZ
VAVAGRDLDNERRNSSPQPWHNRTRALLGVSVLALAVIGLLIVVATAVVGQFGEPEEAPLNFVEPTYSATATQSATTATTTQTITSTRPPETTDINGPPTPSSSSSTTSGSETSTDDTTTRRGTENDDRPSTTRRGPRTNVTRTLNPYP